MKYLLLAAFIGATNFEEEKEMKSMRAQEIEADRSSKRTFAITGDKYLPEFRHGETVQVDSSVALSPGRYVAFFTPSMCRYGIGKIDERGHVVGYPGGESLNQEDLHIVGTVREKITQYL